MEKIREMKAISNIETLIKTKVLCNRHLRPFDKMLMQEYKGEKLIGCEIGVLTGSHALCMLSHAPIEIIYLIDPFINYPGYEEKYITVGLNEYYKQAQKNLSYFVKKGKAVFVKKKFQDALDDIPKELDFAYYDILDDIKRIKKFFKLFYPLIKNGGVIGGWNYDANHSNVSEVVLDFADKHNLRDNLGGINNGWWIRKPLLMEGDRKQ